MTVDELSTYLNALSEFAPASTYHSHRNTLQPFAQYRERERAPTDELDVETAADFIINNANQRSVPTLNGEIDILGSYFAYLWESGPSITVLQIKTAIKKCVTGQAVNPSLKNKLTPLWASQSFDPQLQHRVETLITSLRRTEYGSRTHVFVELIVATSGRLSVLQQIDVGHIDRGAEAVSLQIPETHVVRNCNILQRRTVNLPSSTVDALETYLDYERHEHQIGQKQPLFTTHNGRACPGTLRRSIKEASQSVYIDRLVQNREFNSRRESEDAISILTPRDIRRYALSQL